MTFAPQSASWRTQVGPERTRVRSRTVKRSSAREALGNGIIRHLRRCCSARRRPPSGPTFPDIPLIVHRGESTPLPSFLVRAFVARVMFGAAGISLLAMVAAPGPHQVIEHIGVEI